MNIGVLALQGNFREHIWMLDRCKVKSVEIRKPEQLKWIDALIIPGGESTTLNKLMSWYGLDKAIVDFCKKGKPIFGTCAGAIVLAKEIIGLKQPSLGLIDISVKRNDYGRQVDSFEEELEITPFGTKFKGVFIRAPVIKKIDEGVEVLSVYKQDPVMVRQKNVLIATFHPELTVDKRVHEYFLGMVNKP